MCKTLGRAICLSFILLLAGIPQVFAVRAIPHPVEKLQPDGTTLWVQIQGDENKHYLTTVDGYQIAQDKDGFFKYVVSDSNGSRKVASVVARNLEERSADDRVFISSLVPADRSELLSAPIEVRKPFKTLLGNESAFGPLKSQGIKKAAKDIAETPMLVILVNFTDQQMKYSRQDFDDLLNKEGYNVNGGTGSVRDYYMENSMGAYPLRFDVLGPVMLDNPTAYYGYNDPDAGGDINPREMVMEACRKVKTANPQINFADYDLNADGWVDNVCVIFAGYSEASTGNSDLIWPHSWYIPPGTCVIDGVSITTYSCSAEFVGAAGEQMDGIGTFTHEFGHVLGLSDSYDSDYYENGLAFDLGDYSLMASGSYNNYSHTPPYLMAFERLMLGWCDPDALYTAADIELASIASNQAYFINARPGKPAQEVFVFENRQKTGWDRYIPGHGLFIYHLDLTEEAISKYWMSNGPNAYARHRCVYFKVADGIESEMTRRADGYPGPSGNVSFTADSYPAALNWAGEKVDMPVTDIREENGIIYFQVMGGISQRPQVITGKPSQVDQISAFLSGEVMREPSGEYTRGFCWSRYDNPTIDQMNVESVAIAKGLPFEFRLTGCFPASTYYYRSYLKLADESVIYGATIPFRTECQLKVAPYVEDFLSWSEGEPDCWKIWDENKDGTSWRFDTSTNAMCYSFDYWNDANDWLVSPRMVVPENGQLTFTRAIMDERFIERLDIMVSTTTKEPSAFKHLKSFSFMDQPGYLVAEMASLKEYAGDSVYVAFVCRSEKLSYALWIQKMYITTPLETPRKPDFAIESNGVRINWNAVPGAVNYYMTINKILNTPSSMTRFMCEGDATKISGAEVSAGQVAFNTSGSVEAGPFTGVLSDLKFLSIGSGPFGSSTITVDGSEDGITWVKLGASIKILKSLEESEHYWGSYLKNKSIRYLRFTCLHEGRNVKLSSVTVSYADGYKKELFAQGAVGNTTNFLTDRFVEGEKYGVMVAASDGRLYYDDSEEGIFDYSATAINNVQDEVKLLMAVYGKRIILSNVEAGALLECFDLSGRSLMSRIATSDREEFLLNQESGIYVLRVSQGESSQTFKLFIK